MTRAELGAAQDSAAAAERSASAIGAYATRAAAARPIVIRSNDEVSRYATTDAGRAGCLAADRVRGVDQLDAALFTPAAPGSGARAVPADAGAAPAGRDGDQR